MIGIISLAILDIEGLRVQLKGLKRGLDNKSEKIKSPSE
jgi:hypothetical protein